VGVRGLFQLVLQQTVGSTTNQKTVFLTIPALIVVVPFISYIHIPFPL
jgi:NADH:ubiquinone oxidoreductase subunit H